MKKDGILTEEEKKEISVKIDSGLDEHEIMKEYRISDTYFYQLKRIHLDRKEKSKWKFRDILELFTGWLD